MAFLGSKLSLTTRPSGGLFCKIGTGAVLGFSSIFLSADFSVPQPSSILLAGSQFPQPELAGLSFSLDPQESAGSGKTGKG